MVKKALFLISTLFVWTTQLKADSTKGIALKLTNIESLIQSSKRQYEDWYLAVATVDSFAAIGDGSSTVADNDIVLPKGSRVEVFFPKSVCFELAKVAFIYQGRYTLEINRIELLVLLKTEDPEKYAYFLKAKAKQNDLIGQAECKLKKY